MRSDPALKALEEIRDWAARGEARGIGQRAGLELPDDDDFLESTPGVESDAQEPPSDVFEPPAENADELENGAVDPEQLEQLLALLGNGG